MKFQIHGTNSKSPLILSLRLLYLFIFPKNEDRMRYIFRVKIAHFVRATLVEIRFELNEEFRLES